MANWRTVLLLLCGVIWAQPNPEDRYLRAWQLVGQCKQAEAIPLLESLIAEGSQLPSAYSLLAQAYYFSESKDRGLEYFQRLVAESPTNALGHYGLAEILSLSSQQEAAIQPASECARLDPSLYQCYEQVLSGLESSGRRGDLLSRLSEHLRIEPQDFSGQLALTRAYSTWGKPDQAFDAGRQAIRLAVDSGNPRYLMVAESELGAAYFRGPTETRLLGKAHAESACKLAQADPDPNAWIGHCVRLVNFAPLAGENPYPIWEALIAKARFLDNPTVEAGLLQGVADRFSQDGNLEQALDHLVRGANLLLPLGRRTMVENLFREQGEIQMRMGDFEAAVESFERALEAASKWNDPQRPGPILAKLTVAHNRVGNAMEAIRTAEEAVRIFRLGGHDHQAGAELSDIGLAYLTLGDAKTAARYFRDSLESGKKFGDQGEVVRNSNLLADAYLELGRLKEARTILVQAEKLLPNVRTGQFDIRTHTLLGEVQSRLIEFPSALRHFKAALEMAQTLRDAWLEADLLQRIGQHSLRQGRLEEAVKSFKAALSLAEQGSMLRQVQLASQGLAEVARRRNQPEVAVESLKRAVEALESVRASAPGPELRLGLVKRNWEMFEELIHLLGSLHRTSPAEGHDRVAFTYSERGRARVLLDLLEESKMGLNAGLTREQVARQKKLEREMASALEMVRREGSRAARAKVEHAERELSRWETELRVLNPRYRELKYPEPLDAEAAERFVRQSGTTVVSYSLSRRSSRVWVIGEEGMRSYALPAQATIVRLVEALRRSISRHPVGNAAESYRAPARELYRILLQPLKAHLKDSTRLVVVPDGILHYLPFEVLLGEDGRFFVEHVPVSYAPSVSVLARLKSDSQPGHGRRLLALGNPDFGHRAGSQNSRTAELVRAAYGTAGADLRPLPGTESEVRSIGSLYPANNRRVLIGRDASEAALKSEMLGGYNHIHLATHALIDERVPARSGIVLSLVDTGKEDGVLRINEVMGLGLNADLVTLSACQTGLGAYVTGEGMVGFTRAFLYAGAKSLAVSLWPVSDRVAPELMQTFYRGMRDGAQPVGALRSAKLSMLRSKVAAFKHPYFWAGFVVAGSN